MIPILAKAELLVDLEAEIGECPLPLTAEDAVLSINLPTGAIFKTRLHDGTTQRFETGAHLGAIGWTASGGLIAASNAELRTCAHLGAPWSTVAASFVAEGCRLNDGKPDPWGAFVVGSACLDKTRHDGALYRLDPSGSVTVLASGIGMSNGLDWDAQKGIGYFVDTRAQQVLRFAVQEEGRCIEMRAPLVEMHSHDGLPDGLAVDGDGCIWLAMWGTGEVRRYDKQGRLIGRVVVPARRVTNCCLIGGPPATLAITTAHEPHAAHNRPHPGGALFACQVPAVGQRPRVFQDKLPRCASR